MLNGILVQRWECKELPPNLDDGKGASNLNILMVLWWPTMCDRPECRRRAYGQIVLDLMSLLIDHTKRNREVQFESAQLKPIHSARAFVLGKNWSEKRGNTCGTMAAYYKPHKLSTIIQSFRCDRSIYLAIDGQDERCDQGVTWTCRPLFPFLYSFDLPTICVTWDISKPLQTSLLVLCQIPWHVWLIIFQVVASILFASTPSTPITRFSI